MATSTAELQKDIKKALAKAGLAKVAPEIMSQCTALASALGATPEQMAACWEAFSMNRNVTELNDASMKSYREQVIKDCDGAALVATEGAGAVVLRPAARKNTADGLPTVTPPAKRLQRDGGNGERSHQRNGNQLPVSFSADKNRRVSLSPSRPVAALSSHTPATGHSYDLRQGSGEVVLAYAPPGAAAAAAATPTPRGTPRCRISYQHFATNVAAPYRRFFTTVEDRARALEAHLLDMGEAIRERFALATADADDDGGDTTGNSDAIAGLEAVGIPRQVKITNIGRICNAAHEGKLNDTSVLLEGSRDTSGGARVELDLSKLKASGQSYSLFPGQVVAVEGSNPSGRKLVADRICEGAAQEPQTSTARELLRFHHDDALQGGTPLSILSACGPFTAADNLDFAPLQDLLMRLIEERPDVAILAGPFVDIGNDLVRSGQTTLQFQDGEEILVPYEAFFAHKVAGLIEELFETNEDLQTQFVLVPSLEDATADWVYPQPPLADRVAGGGKILKMSGADGVEIGSLGLHRIETAGHGAAKGSRRVHCVSNPCTLQINELVVGVTSTDVLMHISRDETGNVGGRLRLPRIAQHMLQQRSYYPLCPGAELGNNMDMKQLEQWGMPCRPDLLIVHSKLNKLAEPVLGSTLVVNPGRLTIGSSGGTYASILVNPIQRDVLENAGGDDVEIAHNASQRTSVEIKKI